MLPCTNSNIKLVMSWELCAGDTHDVVYWRNALILYTLRKDFVILQLYWWLFSSTKYCSWNMVYCVVILQSYFSSYNYQQDKSTYYDCWITLQTALKIAASNLYCKITLVWLSSSLIVQYHTTPDDPDSYQFNAYFIMLPCLILYL